MCHEMLESRRLDSATPILVKNPESHPDHVLVIHRPHLGRHHVAELGELYLARKVSVKLKRRLRKTKSWLQNGWHHNNVFVDVPQLEA